MIKKIILIILFCVIQLVGYAQNIEQNQTKYWYYRNRLINNFLKVGADQGCSLPSDARGHESYSSLKWGDGPDWGWYVGVLATEYKLLIDNNQDASETIKELYYALEAFNRLDYTAETYFKDVNGNYGQPSLNGFYIREDVPPNFIDPLDPQSNYKHFNSELVPSDCNKDNSIYCRVDNVRNSLSPMYDPYEESLDNMIHFIMGLSLVNRCVGSGIVYNDGTGVKSFIDGETDMLIEAHKIVDRMVSWAQVHSWRIKNPVTQKWVPAKDGGEAWGFSFGFAMAACKATNPPTLGNGGCPKYQDAITAAAYVPWQAFQASFIFPFFFNNSYSDHLLGLLAALGNSWYFNGIAALPNTTNIRLSAYYQIRDREYLPLLRQVLHGGGNGLPDNKYEYLINVAPCEGPNNNDGEYSSFEWSTQHRFRNPEKRGILEPDPKGEYNGLDYMLLFNLYSIAKSGTKQPYINSYTNGVDRHVAINFPINLPFGSTVLGSHLRPGMIGAFNNITAINSILANGDITYRAGREIALLPGFSVGVGADFGAFIEPFHCEAGGYSYMGSAVIDTIDSFNQPTSYVYYADAGNFHPVLADSIIAPNNNLQSAITITPNPSNGVFTLEVPERTLSEVFIYNDLGQLVYQQVINSIQQIDISSEHKGIYFVKVLQRSPSSGGQSRDKIYIEKVVVQ